MYILLACYFNKMHITVMRQILNRILQNTAQCLRNLRNHDIYYLFQFDFFVSLKILFVNQINPSLNFKY